MGCCFCPEGSCPPDCPFLEVFPVDSPYRTLEELKETGFNLEFIKDRLSKANTPDEQKALARGILSGEMSRSFLWKEPKGMTRLYEDPFLLLRAQLGKADASDASSGVSLDASAAGVSTDD